jgi:hypothetical protein
MGKCDLIKTRLEPINANFSFSEATRMPGRMPFIKNRLNDLAQERDIHIGSYKGLYYRINKEAMECSDFVLGRLKLEDCQFTKVYNEKFKTKKLKPFVLKWVSTYVLELLTCLYKAHLDEHSKKAVYLRNNLLNRHIYEWWSQKTGSKIQVKWLKENEVKAGLKAVTYIVGSFIYRILSRRLCLPVRPKKFRIVKQASGGLKSPIFRDDFFIDDEKLLKKDLLLYTTGLNDPGRIMAYKDVQDSEYECMHKNKLKIPINLLFGRLFKYHLILPLAFIFKNFWKKQNYLLKDWLWDFHITAVGEEILLSHYQIGLELSIEETGLHHIPETIIMNNYGAKSVIFNWSDLTTYDAVGHHFQAFNIYLIWGKAHLRGKRHFVDNVIETGCWIKNNFSQYTKNKRSICEKLGLPVSDYKVIAFFDESFGPDVHVTEEVLLDFWQMMFELVNENTNAIGILKPKMRDEIKLSMMSDKGKETFRKIKQRCLESGRHYFIEDPVPVAPTEVIAISDVNISMDMSSPANIALLCGKIGLYYDTTGNDQHPLAKKYRNKIVFNDKQELFPAVNKILNGAYNPLDEDGIEELLKDYDYSRDEMGLVRFREALLASL